MRKWNIVEELRTPDAIVGFLASVFAREHTNYEVCQAVSIANKAIAAHNLVLEDNWTAECASDPVTP